MIHMIGNAHIDPVWLWRWQEGYQEVRATFQSALDRLGETPEFVFTCACACYYKWIEESAPDMFEDIRRYVKEGRWVIVGGMWIQPDCNMPSGEAMARQLAYSQSYFKEKFGITVRTGYNVDSFGHSAGLPQLLKLAGIDNYVFLRPGPHENASIPGPLFDWYSPDGSNVRAFRIIEGYGTSAGDVAEKINGALEQQQRTGYPMMCFYGVGNHGGGPTIRNILSVKDYQSDNQNGNEVIFSSPDAYFDAVKDAQLALPEWRGELQHHASGCYSATSLIKRLNRHTENVLLRAETFACMAERLAGRQPKSMRQAWDNLMFNQFHDVLCGCAIREAYDDARIQLDEAQSIAAREENEAINRIAWNIDTVCGLNGRVRNKDSHFSLWETAGLGTPVVAFNPHPFACRMPVQLYGVLARVTDDEGHELPLQKVRASRTNGTDKYDSLFMADIPALGYRLFWAYLDGKAQIGSESGVSVSESHIENDKICARFDEKTGAIISLITKDSGVETLSAPATARLIDIEHVDTWAHGVDVFDKDVGAFGNASFEIIENGPVRVALKVTTSAQDCKLIQEYSLCEGDSQLKVNIRLNMAAKHRMVKLCYPVACKDSVSRAEIAYSMIERPCSGNEETGHRWIELGPKSPSDGNNAGLALLNDGKYSFSAKDNELRLTIANTSIFADHYGQASRDGECRYADMGEQEFAIAIVPHTGDWRAANLPHRAELFNRAPVISTQTYHEGRLPSHYEGLRVDSENVSVGMVKQAEKHDGTLLRLSETMGKSVNATIDAPVFGRSFNVSLAPLQIKTLFLPDDASLPMREVPLISL